MTPETETKSTPEEVARLARQTIQVLAETHIIVEKEAFADLVSENLETAEAEMWDLIIASYENAGRELSGHVTSDYLKGFELGGKLLKRMRDVSAEEFAVAKAENPTKI